MRSTSVREWFSLPILLLLAGALWVGTACGEGGTEPDPNGGEDDARIEVTVRADGSNRQGVTVRLFASGSSSALATKQTGSNGVAAFSGLAAGAYEAEIVVPSGLVLPEGEPARKSVTVADGGTGAVSFDLATDGDTDNDVVVIHLTSNNTFDPSSVTISPGTTVRWVNDIDRFHTITPSGHSQWERQEMNNEGQTFEVTFQETGTFDYFCEPHESVGMTGSITVQ